MFDNVTNAPTAPFEVSLTPIAQISYAPGLTGFVSYADGMTVKTNPIKLAWRVPRNNWHEYREGRDQYGQCPRSNDQGREDSQYVYLITTSPMDIRMVTTGAGSTSGGGERLLITIWSLPSVPKKPQIAGSRLLLQRHRLVHDAAILI